MVPPRPHQRIDDGAGLLSGWYHIEGWTCVASRRGKQLETMNIMTSDILRRSWRKPRHAEEACGLINDEQLVVDIPYWYNVK